MATTIYDFQSHLNESVRPSQYRIHINFPADLVSNGVAATKASTFLTNQATIPSYNTQDVQVFYRGRVVHEAGEKEYETWSCTIYNDGNFTIRTALEEWVNAIHDPAVVAGITDPSKYKSTIFIEQLDRNDRVLRVYKLVGAWPLNTGTIELSYQNGSEIESFQPQFSYDYFIVSDKSLLETSTSVG